MRTVGEPKGKAITFAISPGGKLLAAAGPGEKAVRLWDVATGKPVRELTGHKDGVSALAFSPDGQILATAGGVAVMLPAPEQDNAIRLWDVAAGRELRRCRPPMGDYAIFALAFTGDGKMLASGCRNGPVRLWEVATGGQRLAVAARAEVPLAFGGRGRLLVTATPNYDEGVRLWDTLSGKKRGRLDGGQGGIFSLALNADGSRLVTGGEDGTALVWRMPLPPAAGQAGPALSAGALNVRWDRLAGADAADAYQAMAELLAAPAQAVELLGRKVAPVAVKIDQQQLARWLTDLDGSDFEARQAAARELEALNELAEPALRAARSGKRSLEGRRRIEQLLARIEQAAASPETLRGMRAVEVLEWLGTAEARRVLEAFAAGTPEARLTRAAHAALGRLGKPIVVD